MFHLNFHHKSSTRQTVHLMYSFLQAREHLYIKLITFFSIGIQSDFFNGFLNKTQIRSKRFLLVCSIQTGNIPAITTLPGKHHIAGRITAQQFRIVPNGGKRRDKRTYFSWLGMVSFGAVGQMLQGRFKRNQQSQFMPV